MNLGPFVLPNALFVAPMAGVTDRPFRQLCRAFGAGYAVSEMVTSRRDLWHTLKTSRRANHDGEPGPIAVQIAGTDPQMMADAARYNVERGAQIIDINMGCPARKVCNVMAGSALMADEPLALSIVAAVRARVDVPVTVKMRTGPDPARRNAVTLARRLETAGRADDHRPWTHPRMRLSSGQAEYDTIAEVKRAVRVPVVANGDIDSPARRARCAARHRGRRDHDRARRPGPALHIPRGRHFLATGQLLAAP
jgi:tRNA-dihydrouridine synthase B